jgi:multicomponent Na+:H+ antiporter subunit D
LLAYSTVAHLGLFLMAFATLGAEGSQGALIYAAGHTAVKSALFLIAGVILNRYGSVDELDLYGRGRNATVLPWLMLLGGFALAGLPPFGPGLGKAVAEEALEAAGHWWAPAVFVLVSALTGAAVVRAALRIYFGAGPEPTRPRSAVETTGSEEDTEVGGLLRRVPLTMLAPIAVLLCTALALGVVPGVAAAVGTAAGRFGDRAGYLAQTLGPVPRDRPPRRGRPRWLRSYTAAGRAPAWRSGSSPPPSPPSSRSRRCIATGCLL